MDLKHITRKRGLQIIFGGAAVILFSLYAGGAVFGMPANSWEWFLLDVAHGNKGIFVGALIMLVGGYFWMTGKRDTE